MAKMDEMERSIRVRSESLGFKFFLLVLSAWVIVELFLYLSTGRAYNPVPALILLGGLLAQGFYELYMKRRMVAGDEDYREPNRIVKTIVGAIGIMLVTFAVGFFALYIG